MTFTEWKIQSKLSNIDARILYQYITGFSHAQVISHSHEIIPTDYLKLLNQLAQKRQDGQPIAYLIGEREFYGRVFKVNKHVLIPRPETEHLIDTILQLSRPYQALNLWDLGTGSGIIAITLKAERPQFTVYASDFDQNALNVAQKNASILKKSIHFSLGSWFDVTPAIAPNSIDIMVSNPPYIALSDDHLVQGDLRFEPQHALTDFKNGLSSIRHICEHASAFLKNKGYLYIEHGYQQKEEVQKIFQENHFSHIQTIQDYAGLDRITMGTLT